MKNVTQNRVRLLEAGGIGLQNRYVPNGYVLFVRQG